MGNKEWAIVFVIAFILVASQGCLPTLSDFTSLSVPNVPSVNLSIPPERSEADKKECYEAAQSQLSPSWGDQSVPNRFSMMFKVIMTCENEVEP